MNAMNVAAILLLCFMIGAVSERMMHQRGGCLLRFAAVRSVLFRRLVGNFRRLFLQKLRDISR